MSECWPFRHHWEKWQTIEEGKMVRNPTTEQKILHPETQPIVVGRYEYQKRVCLLCGKSQMREVQA